ncbi:MAG: hypothetical protein GYA33_09005 [Thermogutta sp.]|nr:hypothetical protein [Thermogutta sp.]
MMKTELEPSLQTSQGDDVAGTSVPAGGGKGGGKTVSTGGLLNRMLTLTARSLPSYFYRARPWMPGRFVDLWDAMQEIAGEHREFAAKVAEHLVRRGEMPNPGNYPAVYTAWHDLSLDFLADKMIRELRDGAAELEAAIGGPGLDPAVVKTAESLRGLFLDEAERLQTLWDDLRRASPASPENAA